MNSGHLTARRASNLFVHRCRLLPVLKALNACHQSRLYSGTHHILSQINGVSGADSSLGVHLGDEEPHTTISYHIPQRVREKVISAEDAVALVGNGDTVCVSGFVCQGAPEALLKVGI